MRPQTTFHLKVGVTLLGLQAIRCGLVYFDNPVAEPLQAVSLRRRIDLDRILPFREGFLQLRLLREVLSEAQTFLTRHSLLLRPTIFFSIGRDWPVLSR